MSESRPLDAWGLLERYVAIRSEEAFRELETQYMDLVYSAAVRLLAGGTSERSLQLLDNIYERVGTQATSFLSPEDIEKFGAFRTNAISVNRMGIAMNRKMMSPGSP